MAYMSQQKKAELVAFAKPILDKYGLRGTFSVRHHMVIVCHITRGPIDFASQRNDWTGHESINVYHISSQWTDDARDALVELHAALNTGNHDNSDPMTDYFDVGWYVDINIGRWNRPYVLETP